MECGCIQGLPKFFGYPLLSQERVKLRTSNFVGTFIGIVREYVFTFFFENPKNATLLFSSGISKQESWAVSKVTAQCALYMGALKIFGTPWLRPRLLFPKSLRVSEILPFLFSRMPLPCLTSSLPQISPCSLRSRWIAFWLQRARVLG